MFKSSLIYIHVPIFFQNGHAEKNLKLHVYEEVRENALNSMSGDTNVFMKFMHWILSYRIISFKSFVFFFLFLAVAFKTVLINY